MTGGAFGRLMMAVATAAVLTGCEMGNGPLADKPAGATAPGGATEGAAAAAGAGGAITAAPLDAPGKAGAADAKAAAEGAAPAIPAQPAVAGKKSVKLVDRDVEAPEIFQTTDLALWDGRPSLGGVWVASPDAKDPERVILRNPSNGKFVIGALFRRERDNPGPTLQISSDAAAALGLLAGEPGKINVTALRREEAPQTAPDASKPILDAAETVASETLDPIPGAAAAIDTAEAKGKGKKGSKAAPAPTPAAPVVQETSKPQAAAKGGLVQVGIFSVEANAKRAADTLKAAGVAADIRSEKSQGKSFWSVTARGDKGLLAKIKQAGFKDAYFLKG